MTNTAIIEQIREANTICSSAYANFANADNIRDAAETKKSRSTKINIAIIIGAACLVSQILTGIFGIIFGIFANVPVLGKLFGGLGILLTFAGTVFVIIVLKNMLSARKNEEYERSIAEADAAYQAGEAIFCENTDTLSVIPSEYWYPMATEYILRMFETGRAGTMNEALQMYDEYHHRWRMEQANEAIIRQQESILSAAQAAERNSGIAAAAGVVSVLNDITRL